MKVFVYEYTCCQSLTEETATASLRAEGWAMLSAILSDLAGVDGVTVETMLAEDHARIPFAAWRVGPRDEERVFRDLAARAEYTFVIAPEFNDLLYHRCRWVEECSGRMLGPGSELVLLTGDKLALARHLGSSGVPTPTTYPLAEVLTGTACVSFPAVCKPRQGAGSLSTYLLQGLDDLRTLQRDEPSTAFIVQPFVSGAPASVGFLFGPHRCLALPPAAQRLSGDGRFRYLGGHVPLPPVLAERAQRVAQS
ncbi:MAG TPA: ATP-grasp domain-containing protein, partial [Gemmataceae bacterium]|nr:ATP-grasp domain-containing protein [Gemmataceae bacterium]